MMTLVFAVFSTKTLSGPQRYEEAERAFRQVLQADGSRVDASEELKRVQMAQIMVCIKSSCCNPAVEVTSLTSLLAVRVTGTLWSRASGR